MIERRLAAWWNRRCGQSLPGSRRWRAGFLRTIAATTWAEYRQYFEKDPALTRRFQTVSVDEPDAARGRSIWSGHWLSMIEKHHQVILLDEAVEAAVKLSQRATFLHASCRTKRKAFSTPLRLVSRSPSMRPLLRSRIGNGDLSC